MGLYATAVLALNGQTDANGNTILNAIGILGDLNIAGDLDVDGLHPLSKGMTVYMLAIKQVLAQLAPQIFGGDSSFRNRMGNRDRLLGGVR